MVKLIIGVKGTGKTKSLINMVNTAVETTNGNVICIEKGEKLTYDVKHQARLIDTNQYIIRTKTMDDATLKLEISKILKEKPNLEVYNIMNVLFAKTIPLGYIYKISSIIKICAEMM